MCDRDELRERLQVLVMPRYGVDPRFADSWFLLCCQLASELGLVDEPKRAGRKLEWSMEDGERLVAAIDEIRDTRRAQGKRKISIGKAIEELQGRPEWKDRKRLEPRYHEYKRKKAAQDLSDAIARRIELRHELEALGRRIGALQKSST